ncbi:DUF2390 domain-containing protein [Aeromonas cavernicola]|uniref:DUF2390 domain-containing protein n=1 Tax=Aeromonas cavernicola TaxID=1006623 RepID=A0A2H9U531_9GAMM|nr:DUF2390 domain-containing protein [Aeromonas cavernicola]PJG59099.1 DUF2390 domain-containing protein [Aeromonas cavernicola]
MNTRNTVALNELPSADHFWHWSGKIYGERSQDWLTVQTLGGNVNLALLLHWLDRHGIAGELTALASALADTAPLLQPLRQLRQQLKSAGDTQAYQACLSQELLLERQQQAALLHALQHLPLFHGHGHHLSTYLSRLGAQQGPLRDLIC